MSHLKRLAVPKTWGTKRKGIKYIVSPNPGPHNKKMSLPLVVVFRDMLGYASNLKEVRNILFKNNILVDGIRRKDPKFPVGIFDLIEIKETNEYFRIVIIKKKLDIIPIQKNESNIKPCHIKGKKKLGKKLQISLHDGKNMIIENNEYKVGDTIFVEFPKKTIKNHLKLEKGNLVYLVGGKHIGDVGTIENISGNNITYKRGKENLETLKKYVFVIGKDKSLINIGK